MRVVVAMSGGVDSSVAAAILAAEGHDVIGLSMQLYDQSGTQAFGSCCSLDDLHDARRVAAAIGIPHYILNFERQFQQTVVANFVGEYVAGRTPLPCAHCNSDLKFSTLLERGPGPGRRRRGHRPLRARRARRRTARWQLRRGVDPDKDQSYFLFSLTQEQLARAAFPVGALTKAEVRAHARALGLRVADKPDSQEICFVPDGDYAAFVERQAPAAVKAGVVADESGRTLGHARGRAPLHHRPAQGAGRVVAGAALRAAHRRRVRSGHRGPARGARAARAHRVAGELDVRRGAARVARRARRRSATGTAPRPAACARCRMAAPRSSRTSRCRRSRRARPPCSTTATSWSAAAGLTSA